MAWWKIPVTWESCVVIDVEADTLEEAIEIAKDDDGVIPIPSFPDYVDGSWQLSTTDIDYIRQGWNQ